MLVNIFNKMFHQHWLSIKSWGSLRGFTWKPSMGRSIQYYSGRRMGFGLARTPWTAVVPLYQPRRDSYGEFQTWGYSKIDCLYSKILLEWWIWGYPHFRKPPLQYPWLIRPIHLDLPLKNADAPWITSVNVDSLRDSAGCRELENSSRIGEWMKISLLWHIWKCSLPFAFLDPLKSLQF